MNFETYKLLKNFRENGVERRDVGLVVNCIVCIVNFGLECSCIYSGEVSQKIPKFASPWPCDLRCMTPLIASCFG